MEAAFDEVSNVAGTRRRRFGSRYRDGWRMVYAAAFAQKSCFGGPGWAARAMVSTMERRTATISLFGIHGRKK
jgi:hypothetical protein